jgi:outer membrane protein OmpA-like peptidoglycan-associated protein
MEVAVIITWLGMLIASLMNNPVTTTVVLVDNGKEHNAIVVETKKGSVIIDKPYHYVQLSALDAPPSSIKSISKDEVKKKFKTVIKSTPLKPISVLLYFKNNSNELTEESKAKLPEILEYIKKRAPCDVTIIGHADTKGSEEYNIKISLKRAEMVKKWILSQDIKINSLNVESYGESDLLVQTPDNVSEPKNRRVELLVK